MATTVAVASRFRRRSSSISRSAAASRSLSMARSRSSSAAASRSSRSRASRARASADGPRRGRAAGSSGCCKSPNSPGLANIRSTARRRTLAALLTSPLITSSRLRKANKLIRSCAASKIPGLLQTNLRKCLGSTPRSSAAFLMAPKCLLRARAACSSLTCASDAGRCENIVISDQPAQQLRLRSGPGPLRRLEIRLITRIGDIFRFPRTSPPRHTKLALAQRRLEPLAPLHPAPANAASNAPAKEEASRALRRSATYAARSDPRHVLNPIAKTPRLQTVLAGEGAGVQPQRPAPATAMADEKTPAAAVGKADVLHRHSEDLAVRKLDDGGRGVRADLAQSAQPRGRKKREIVDRQPHAGER